jgi:opacity protein-like surface antigen/outer membrane protein OmpA-like peptidoglycan-associated protein
MRKEILLGVVALTALWGFGQDTAKKDPPSDDNVPRFEVPVGFSFVNVHPSIPQITSFNVFGGGGEFDVNFGQYFGIKADFMGYTQSSGVHVVGSNGSTVSVSGNVFTYMFGPQIKKHTGRLQPFGEVLFGAAHTNFYANAYRAETGNTVSGSSDNNGFAMAAGVGLDYKITQNISFRPVQVDYLLTRFKTPLAPSDQNQNNFRYFVGIDFTWGGKPPIPPSASCSVTPTEIFAGDPVTASITTQNFNPKHTITYSWTSTGGTVSGTTESAQVNTSGLAPGSYSVTGTATDSKEKKNNTASCNASFTVKQPRPPVASCSADPTTVQPGSSSTINVTASSPDGRPITYSYSASAGNVSGTGNTATLSTAGAAPGTITVTANVVDDRNLSTTCTAAVNVQAPPVATVVEQQEVGTCTFSDPRRTARVDNVCKATLDEVALRLQREPNGRVVVVGYADEEESVKVSDIDGQRSENIKYYLTSGESQAQIDPSRIEARKGPHGNRSATLYFVPEGGTFTVQGTETVDESQVKGQSRNAKPARKAKKTAAQTAPQ